jgi:colicin import membrane protein
VKEGSCRSGINNPFHGTHNQSKTMKTKLTTLLLSTLMLGLSSAAPKPAKQDPAPKKAQQAQNHKKKEEPKKKEDHQKAAEVKKQKVAPAGKAIDPAKAKEAAEQKKADAARKALADAAKKKADEAKMVRDSLVKIKELAAKKKSAESNRDKTAEALKSAEKNVAAIDGEMKKIAAQLKLKAENDRKQAEQAKARQLRMTEENEHIMMASMKRELQNLKQTVERLNLQVSDQKEGCEKCPSEAKKK